MLLLRKSPKIMRQTLIAGEQKIATGGVMITTRSATLPSGGPGSTRMVGRAKTSELGRLRDDLVKVRRE